ncbi:hypothetical protein [Streptomyces sp. NPDC093225]|uniref:hypothetical protein n=1 Tax=Streptomyces sp. NPDC093225 TaxID=3366034 RepID=UPI0038134788
MTGTNWHVLVEERRNETYLVDTRTVASTHMSLYFSDPVDGGREGAAELAEELARTFVPDWMAAAGRPGDAPARTAYLTTDGTWLVTLDQDRGGRTAVLRIHPARLMHRSEQAPAPREPLFKGLRRVLSREAPQPAPAP